MKTRLMIPHSAGVLSTRICTVCDPNPQVVAADHSPRSREHELAAISRRSLSASCCRAKHIGAAQIMIKVKFPSRVPKSRSQVPSPGRGRAPGQNA